MVTRRKSSFIRNEINGKHFLYLSYLFVNWFPNYAPFLLSFYLIICHHCIRVLELFNVKMEVFLTLYFKTVITGRFWTWWRSLRNHFYDIWVRIFVCILFFFLLMFPKKCLPCIRLIHRLIDDLNSTSICFLLYFANWVPHSILR